MEPSHFIRTTVYPPFQDELRGKALASPNSHNTLGFQLNAYFQRPVANVVVGVLLARGSIDGCGRKKLSQSRGIATENKRTIVENNSGAKRQWDQQWTVDHFFAEVLLCVARPEGSWLDLLCLQKYFPAIFETADGVSPWHWV